MSAAAQIGAQWIFLVKIAVLDLLLRKNRQRSALTLPTPSGGVTSSPIPPKFQIHGNQ